MNKSIGIMSRVRVIDINLHCCSHIIRIILYLVPRKDLVIHPYNGKVTAHWIRHGSTRHSLKPLGM